MDELINEECDCNWGKQHDERMEDGEGELI